MALQPYLLEFEAGFSRDGTELASASVYTEGLWCRFQRGRPRKMGGYRTLSQGMTGISRGLHMQTLNGYSYIHSGFSAGVEVYQTDQFGQASVPANVTPSGFVTDPSNFWQMDSYYDTNLSQQQILAFVTPSLNDISYGAATGNLYTGAIYGTQALTSVTGLATDVTGGICVIPPYLVLYGSNGLFQWSTSLSPLDFSGEGSGAARVADQKIVKALPLWGNDGFSPSCVAWTMNSVIKVYFVGGAPVFAFDPLTNESSILSPNAVTMGSNNIFYWAGQDRFMMTNGLAGQVNELPNDKNINFFYDNLNRPYAQKAFAVYNARWGEVWFCAPLFGATEPNWAIIYNDRERCWYDTPLPNSGRSAGIKNDLGVGMVLSGVDPLNSTYRLWQHERGTDAVDGTTSSAIRSFYTTGIITAENFQQPLDKDVKIDTLEPDFIQSGPLSVDVLIRGNARDPFEVAQSRSFDSTAATPLAQQVPLKTTARQTKLQFTSNVAGGDYQAGKTLAFIETDQSRRTR